jgi:hypothetical protein
MRFPRRLKQTLLRSLSDDEELVAFGCVEAEWQILAANPATTGIGTPPFRVDRPNESEWGRQAEALLSAGKYDDARLLLLKVEGKDPAAQNLLGVLDAFGFGYGARKDSAFMRFREAAATRLNDSLDGAGKGGITRNTLRPPWKTSQELQSCRWCRGVMETWCRWKNARRRPSRAWFQK